jgi:putative ABC transport system substrate-binding protein
MRRREFITLISGAATWPLAARAQQANRPFRVGLLAFGQELASPLFTAFRDEMHRLGYIEGRTFVLEFRSARDADRLRGFAAELARLPVDVILTDSGTASIAAKDATASIPVVMAVIGDPVGIGLVASLARPGGNVTGFSILSPELGSKRLALLKEAVPATRLVGLGRRRAATPLPRLSMGWLRAASPRLSWWAIPYSSASESSLPSWPSQNGCRASMQSGNMPKLPA